MRAKARKKLKCSSSSRQLRQSLTADPAESLTLRMKFQEQSAVAAKLLQVAEENDKHVLAMVA